MEGTKNINLRRDPEEEFFMLAILALKMQHTENHEAEFIYQIDSQKLYEQVKQIKIPFHKWYQWLETKFCLLKVAYEQEQEELYNDPVKNPEGLINPYKSNQVEVSTESSDKKDAAEVGAFGIFDKIKNYLNRQSKEEREEEERKQREKDRKLLLGNHQSSHGFALKQNF